MSACPHYLEMPTGVPDEPPQTFECDLPLNHPKKHLHRKDPEAVVSGEFPVQLLPDGWDPAACQVDVAVAS